MLRSCVFNFFQLINDACVKIINMVYIGYKARGDVFSKKRG